MTHGTYVGPIRHLRGQRAMVMDGPHDRAINAQFNDRSLTLEGFACRGPTRLAFGWHAFPLADFEIDPPIDWDTPE